MKYFYLLLILLTAIRVNSQEPLIKIPVVDHSIAQKVVNSPQARIMATCSADTIRYPYHKEMVLSQSAPEFNIDAMLGNVRTASQAYPADQDLVIKGVQFWGGAYSISSQPKSIPVVVSVWSVDAQQMPVTELTSTVIQVTNVHTFNTAIFPVPLTVTGNYAVSVRCSVSSDTLAVIINNAGLPGQTPAYGESLGWRRFGSGTWNKTVSFFGQDVEYMIFPIVEYDFMAGFTTDGSATTTAAETFTNTSSPILQNRVYNLYAFNAYFGLTANDSTCLWDYDDLPGNTGWNGVHLYNGTGSKTVQLTTRMKGYYTSCSDSKSAGVLVSGPANGVVDTIRYPYHKEMVLSQSAPQFNIDAMVGNVRTASQAYTADQDLVIKGVQFWGGAYSISSQPKSIPVVVSVWSVDAQQMPVTELTSTVIQVTNLHTFNTAIFPVPLTVTGNYAVSVRCSVISDTLAVIINNAGLPGQTPAYGESLGWRRFGSGTWNQTTSFFGQDVEYMIFPIVRYFPTAAFTSDQTATGGIPETFTNTSAAVLQNRMYNLHVFDQYFGLDAADSTFTWHYGDGISQLQHDGQHTYTAVGSMNVELIANLKGYFIDIYDTATLAVDVLSSLPVTLGAFTGRSEAGGNLLQWHAVTEDDVASYYVERSADGRQFSPVAVITARNMDNARYSYLDSDPANLSYYRLRIIDQDGRSEHSRIIKVTREAQPFTVNAVYAHGGLQLQVFNDVAGPVMVKVYNAAGGLLLHTDYYTQAGENKFTLRGLQPAAKGVYYITVFNGRVSKTVSVAGGY